MTPILSIVIANYNYGRFLDDSIRSILSQIGDGVNQVPPGSVELIIIDGGSTDDSVEVIRKYAGGLPAGVGSDDPSLLRLKLEHTPIKYWISEGDNGQSDAFNKGFAKAKGTFLTWLNADDLYMPGALCAVVNALRKHPSCDWATANFLRFQNVDKRIIQAGWGPNCLPRCFQSRRFPLMIFGPTAFWRRSVFVALGPIDVNLHYGMDTEYWWRLTVNGCKQFRINYCCWAFRMHEDSKTAEYGDHESCCSVKRAKIAEHNYTIHKHGVMVARWAKFILRVWRVLDLSYIIHVWRMIFVVGKVLKI